MASRLVLWMVACGLLGAHLVAVTLSDPRDIFQDPLVLIRLWEGLSSVGGIAGGILAGLWLMRRSGLNSSEIRAYLDLGCLRFPLCLDSGTGWLCSSHDHPGIPTDGWWAVQYPDGPRFDLGLLEFFFALVLAGLFQWLDRRPRSNGFYLGLFFVLYGPVRFFLDELRVGDAQYLGFTPAQYGCVVAVFLGGAVLARISHGGVTMAPDFSLQRVLATEERSRNYAQGSMCGLKGKKTSQGTPSTVGHCKLCPIAPTTC